MFTNRKVDADSYIAHLCQEHAGKAYLVTSDRGLRARTVQNVIRIIDSQEFLDKYLYPMVDINSIVPTARPVQIDQ
jgi:rRNA-processing protein FCF1